MHSEYRVLSHPVVYVDTPDHTDSGGEVERILKMVNGIILLVDDEQLECTPRNLRIRKRELDHGLRMRKLMKIRAQENGRATI